MKSPKEQPSKGQLRPTPLEEALALPALRKQVADHERAEFQDAANRAMIRMAEKVGAGEISTNINEAALRKFASQQQRTLKKWPDIKQAAASRFPGLRADDPLWGRIQNAIRQKRSRAKSVTTRDT